jgi:S-DNA-T family DNA segregation ATPase FtsK/SpoIIIE
MPEDLHSNDSPFIRIARSSDGLRSTTSSRPSGRVAVATADDYDIEESPFNDEANQPARRTRVSRPMPTRLSEERAMQMREREERMMEEEAARQREAVMASTEKPTRKKRSKASSKADLEAEQIALDLKQPRKRPDSTVKKRQVLGTVLFVFAVLVTIAIVSYTPNDAAVAETKFSDLVSVITRTDPVVNAHADVAQNRLGLIGAMLADLLINKTIGYASIIYPIFFGWWALAFFRFTTRQRQRLTLATTFFLVTAILFSATIGTTQLISALPHIPREWSGAVGQFLGLTFTRLIGSIGALIVYATAFVITLVFSIDLDIEKTFMRIVGIYQAILTRTRRFIIEFWEKREVKRAAKEEARLAEEKEVEEESGSGFRVPGSEDAEVVVTKPATLPMTAATEAKKPPSKSVVIGTESKVDPTLAVPSEPGTRNPEPGTRNPKPETQTPKPETQTPKPETRNPEPEQPVKILRPNEAIKPSGVAGAAFGASIPPDQPLLKVRPVSKVLDPNGGIPRITKPASDRLGTTGNIHRLSNGAVNQVAEAESKQTTTATPNDPSTASKVVAPTPMSEAVSINDAKLNRMRNDAPSAKLGAETPVAKAVPEPGTVIDKMLTEKAPKIEIRKEPVPVQLGDESIVSNAALPHSVMGGDELRDVVREHQTLSRQVAKEIEKSKKTESDATLFEPEAVKRMIIPENPYQEVLSKYRNPTLELLTPADPKDDLDADDEELAMKGRLLRDKLATFGVDIENITVTPGPVVTLYEFTPAEGVKVSRVENLTDDIALAMKARGIRIIAPIPGRGTIGVEIPNDVPKMVVMRSLLESESFRKTKMNLPLALGKTISGDVYVDDLNKMPHLLIAGATGAGKSVGVNGIIASLLYAKSPKDVKFVIVDPKKIELSLYKKLRKHYLIVSPEAGEDIVTTPAFAVVALKAVELEMERRYDKLAKAAVRSLVDYNIKVAQGKLQSTQDEQHYHLPYIVVIIDELADLMITAGREIEEPICRIAQMARAVGIHLILATQRPSVDVITGVIKANFPARIAYQVATRVDSRTILDSMGAEQLLGNGDMLYQPSGTPKPIRLQAPFISTEEVEAIVEAVEAQDGPGLSYSRPWTLPSLKQKNGSSFSQDEEDNRDELFEEAARVIVRHQQGSVSVLQRRLKIGYSRAARIVDELEQAGIVSAFDGAKARQVLCENEEELELVLEGLR